MEMMVRLKNGVLQRQNPQHTNNDVTTALRVALLITELEFPAGLTCKHQ